MQPFKLKTHNYSHLFFCLIVLATSVISCKETNKQLPKHQDSNVDTDSGLSLIIADSVRFRRSYADHLQWTEKEEAYRTTCHPNLDESIDTFLLKRLNELGIMKGDSLLLDKFKNIADTTLKSSSGTSLHLTTTSLTNPLRYTIKLFDRTDSTRLQLFEDVREVSMAFSDLIADGFPEIIVLRSYYIINGDNYYINIYQIKTP